MNSSALKIIIIVLLSFLVGGLSFYFYNEYKKRQIVEAIAKGLAEGLKEMNEEFENISENSQYSSATNNKSIELSEIDNQTDRSNSNIEIDLPVHDDYVQSKNTKKATCQIDLAGRTVYKGNCNFQQSTGGSFSISNFDTDTGRIDSLEEISVEIERPGQAAVFGINSSSINEWGSANRSTKQKACWIGNFNIDHEDIELLDNKTFKVCAW